jgi:predicted Rossmann fold flavoprotein
MNCVDVIIVGAGPAGLLAAAELGIAGRRVILLEKNQRAGLKILVSGAGQCNLCNNASLDEHLQKYGKKSRFVKSALYAFPPQTLREWFASHGLSLVLREDGKYFPASMKASDVVASLLQVCQQNGVELIYKADVKKIEKSDDVFIIETETAHYSAPQIVLCTGGSSWPRTGSNGDGYKLALSLGHSLVVPRPGLASASILNYDCIELAGYSMRNIELSIYRGDKKIELLSGDVLFTHEGLSGPAILHASRYLQKNDVLKLRIVDKELFQYSDDSELDKLFINLCMQHPRKTLKGILRYFKFPDNLCSILINRTGLLPDCNASMLNRSSRQKLLAEITGMQFMIKNIEALEKAMVTVGGIELTEINAKSMESRLVKGLFFAGEILDVDGDTGGFNLQFAFSSAALAVQTIIAQNIRETKV